MRQLTLKIENLAYLKQQLLAFSEAFEICNIYDSNGIKAPLRYGRFELLAAFGCNEMLEGDFENIASHIDTSKDWIFANLTYESYLKFESNEKLNTDEACFYKPQLVCRIGHDSDTMVIENNGISEERFDELVQKLLKTEPVETVHHKETLDFSPCTSKATYIKNIENIQDNILEGDYYEINYCQKFECKAQLKNTLSTFNVINQKSPTPFAAFFKNKNFNILCTSPERFIYKEGETLISQPIKGTNKRLEGSSNSAQLAALRNSEKEIAENVMIVDLVRNDMARICHSGTVKVEELCGTYPFALVNQMISTVKGELKQDIIFAEILKALFPMGSMTGAPKIEVMKNIAHYETTPRGWYSGCMGYIMPDGNFDFNVVIRTLVEDKFNSDISYHVGGAITYDSLPEDEYEECLLKGQGMRNL